MKSLFRAASRETVDLWRGNKGTAVLLQLSPFLPAIQWPDSLLLVLVSLKLSPNINFPIYASILILLTGTTQLSLILVQNYHGKLCSVFDILSKQQSQTEDNESRTVL